MGKNNGQPAPEASGAPVTEAQVLNALRQIIDPDLRRDIVSLGMIKGIEISRADGGAKVAFKFELTTPACPVRSQFESQARAAVAQIPGVAAVDVQMSANVKATASMMGQAAMDLLPGVRNTIAIASGKGGVGKSTVAANLAVALAQTDAKVGLLDCDIYGPSIPALMGVHDRPKMVDEKIQPLERFGVKLMSLGFLLEDNRPVIWRGPLVHGAVRQMLGDVNWGTLDYLLIDLPPGTGDAQLSLAQAVPLSGVVIVSTPQDVALNIAIKALQMFKTMKVETLGIVENMSYFECPNCGHRAHIFAHGKVEAAATRLKVPYLGDIPLDEEIRVSGDEGVPVVAARPESAQAKAFTRVAEQLAAQISIKNQWTIPVIQ